MRWRWLLITLGCLFLAVIAAGVWYLQTYNYNRLKPEIVEAVKTVTGRDLNIDGDIRLRLGFSPIVSMRDVRFANAKWGSRPDLARVKWFQISLGLGPLFTGRIEVRQLTLVEPDILLETDPSGRSNLDFVKKIPVPESPGLESLGFARTLLRNIKISNGQVRFRDGRNGKTHRLSVSQLKGKRAETSDRLAVSLEAVYNGRPLAATGKIGRIYALLNSRDKWPVDLTVRFRGVTLGIEGTILDAPAGKGLDLTCSVESRSTLKAFELAGIKKGPALGPFKAVFKLADPAPGRYRVSDLVLTVSDPRISGVVTGSVSDLLAGKGLDLVLSLEGESIRNSLAVAGIKKGPALGPFKAVFRLADPAPDRYRVSDLVLTVSDPRISGVVKGSVGNARTGKGLDLVLSLEGESSRSALELAGIKKGPALGPFKAVFRLTDPAAAQYDLTELALTLAGSKISGELKIALAGSRPKITGKIGSEKLDLRRVVFAKSKKRLKRKPGKKKRLFSTARLPLDFLGQIEGEIDFGGTNVLLPRLAFERLDFHAVMTGSRLTVRPISFKMGGGTGAGAVVARRKGKSLILDGTVSANRVGLGTMLRRLGAKKSIEGRLDAKIKIRGWGSSVAGIMGGLNGRVTAVVGKGVIHNQYIDLVGGNLSSTLFRVISPEPKKSKTTKINCLVGHFDIKKGVADCKGLFMDTDRMSVSGKGEINLKTEEIDIRFDPSPKHGVGVKGLGGITLSLGALAKPTKLGGTLANPSLVIDSLGTAMTIGKVIGGFTLAGPLGLAAFLADVSSGDENSCLEAIRAARGLPTKPRKKASAARTQQKEKNRREQAGP
jgi:uncharacterized protein involved in outer membrane biogenesis